MQGVEAGTSLEDVVGRIADSVDGDVDVQFPETGTVLEGTLAYVDCMRHDHLADGGRVRQAPPRSCHPSGCTAFFRGTSRSRTHTRQKVVPLLLLQGAYLHEVCGILLSG